jgi:threonine synthase
MKFISTSGKSDPVSFFEAMSTGLAPDGGLYMPASVPVLPAGFCNSAVLFWRVSFRRLHSKTLWKILLTFLLN